MAFVFRLKYDQIHIKDSYFDGKRQFSVMDTGDEPEVVANNLQHMNLASKQEYYPRVPEYSHMKNALDNRCGWPALLLVIFFRMSRSSLAMMKGPGDARWINLIVKNIHRLVLEAGDERSDSMTLLDCTELLHKVVAQFDVFTEIIPYKKWQSCYTTCAVTYNWMDYPQYFCKTFAAIDICMRIKVIGKTERNNPQSDMDHVSVSWGKTFRGLVAMHYDHCANHHLSCTNSSPDMLCQCEPAVTCTQHLLNVRDLFYEGVDSFIGSNFETLDNSLTKNVLQAYQSTGVPVPDEPADTSAGMDCS